MIRALVCVLLIIAAFAADEQGKPFLIVRKSVSETHVAVGGSLTVSVVATNYGQSPAFDVQISDTHPIEKVAKTNSAEKLDFNESVELTYVVASKEEATLKLDAAEVTYLATEGDNTRLKASSNLIREEELVYRQEEEEEVIAQRGTVRVVSAAEYERLNTKYIKEIAGFLFLAAVPVFFPFFIYRQKQSQIDHLLRETKRK